MRTSALVLLSLLLSACHQGSQPVKDESKDPVREYSLHGEIVRLDSKEKIAVIKHQAIGDGHTVWMGAMTMEFPVKDEKEFARLRPSESIDATVYVRGETIPVFWIGQIHEVTAAPAPAAK
jgi:Cu/Ag efflux protein CusF